jgi:hypothetical protein
MKRENETEVIEFQTWLDQAIRRAWILAFAVAIPGAFLATLWFPHSPEALFGVAMLGIGISVISDSVERAKKRRLEEISQIKAGVQQAVDGVTTLVDEKISGWGAKPSEEQAKAARAVEQALTSNLFVVEQLRSIHNVMAAVLEKLPGQPTKQEHYPKSTPGKFGPLPGLDPVILGLIETQWGTKLPQTVWPNVESDRQIVVKIDQIAKEMHIPIENFVQHLHDLTSRRDLFFHLHEESDEASNIFPESG